MTQPPVPSGPRPSTSTAAEQRALREYAARLRPTIAAAIQAAEAAGQAGKPLTGSTSAVLTAIGLGTLATGILAALSLASLDRFTRTYAGSGDKARQRRAALWAAREAATEAGATAGADALAAALRDISDHADRDRTERERDARQSETSPAGSLPTPGRPTQVKPPYAFTDADGLTTAISLTTKEAAKVAAASAGGWTYKTWVDSHDHRVRMTHKILGSRGYDNHRIPIDVPFLSPSGAKLMHPGDPSAPLHETINCRCHLILTAP